MIYKKYIFRQHRKGEPDLVPGHFLWGNGESFRNNAVDFLHKSQKNHGDIFTIRFFHQRLTIIMDPHSVEAMSKERKFDFEAIQKQVNMNVFSFVLVNARKMIKEAGKTVRGSYLATAMRRYATHLEESFNSVLKMDSNENVPSDQTDGLRKFVSKTNFAAMFYTIFGRSDNSEFEPVTVYQCFDVFHKYFNYLWLGMPIMLFPKATKALQVLCKQPKSDEILAREDLSDYIRYSTEFMKSHGQSEQDIMGHNLVYLHVNYNTFRLSFWCMYFLLADQKAYETLYNEVMATINKKRDMRNEDETGPIVFNYQEIEKLPVLDSIVQETLRMCSGVFMVRYVTDDCDFKLDNGKVYTIRKGDRVAIYPPAIHKDPEIFEDPLVYKFDRFIDAKFYKNNKQLKNPVLTFGTLCPGKRYALLQAKWYIFSQMNTFKMSLASGEKAEMDINYHGHEILPPVKDVDIHYKLREDYQQITMHWSDRIDL